MTQITILNDVEVTLLEVMGSDSTIADAARVSLSPNRVDRLRDPGLINTLLKKKHGSPFEHTYLKFHIKAPIFAFREFHRHRIGWSYNEISGRYVRLPSEFYIPAEDRPLINAGTSMNPKFVQALSQDVRMVERNLRLQYQAAWNTYEKLIDKGIANEVARSVLPVGIMSQMIASCNVRSLLHFLSLRTDDELAAYPSKPQYEIELIARKMEYHLQQYFPSVYESFNENGRVAP